MSLCDYVMSRHVIINAPTKFIQGIYFLEECNYCQQE